MKYLIIIGFFGIILAVSASPLDRYDVQCVEYPERKTNAIETCLKSISTDIYESLLSRNKTLVTRYAKCFALCLYTGTGEFADGRFNPITLENDIRKHLGSHPFVDKVVEITLAAANAANAEQGDDCDKAYAYLAAFDNPYSQLMLASTFCPSKSSNQFFISK